MLSIESQEGFGTKDFEVQETEFYHYHISLAGDSELQMRTKLGDTLMVVRETLGQEDLVSPYPHFQPMEL
jgi:hypothetical protein